MKASFAIGLEGVPTSGASLTWGVQHTFDDLSVDAERQITISRAATVATVTDANHGLSANDSVFIFGSGDANLEKATGVDVASIIDANTYTYTVANTGATTAKAGCRGKNLRVNNHATLTNIVNTRQDGNYAFPCRAIRLRVTAWVSGSIDLLINQGADF